MTPTTIPDLLSLRAHEQPLTPVYTYLGNGRSEVDTVTYADLEKRAHALANVLLTHARPMDRVVLIYPSGLDFLTAFFGCLYARLVAVPLHSPRPGRHNDRLTAIIANADASLVLTTRELFRKVERAVRDQAGSPQIEILTTDHLDLSSPQGISVGPIRAEDLAFLQYTSGSTSIPKGVMVSHGNLIANQRMIHGTFRGTEDSVVVGWLPLYHDMGLIGNVLQTLWMGGRCVLMSPAAFLQRPVHWLEVISKYRGTISGGPDFAYRLCIEKISDELLSGLDLSCWTVAFNGSEPIRPDTMKRFAKKFEPCGFTQDTFVPCYGLAEATLFVSGKPAGEPPVLYRCSTEKLRGNLAQQDELLDSNHVLAGSGSIAEGLGVEIVEPETSRLCAVGEIGEIWVTGPSVARGYWRDEQATEELFHAHTTTSNTSFLRTGDLGFRSGNELFITGRLKDLIILRGQNHYPQDIEATATASDPALATSIGAAFSLENDAGNSVVLVQEVPRQLTSPGELTRLERAIRHAVGEQEGITLERVVFVKFGSVPRTTSGKVRRQACRVMYESKTLEELDRTSESSPMNRANLSFSEEGKETARLSALCQMAGEMAQIKAHDIDPGMSLFALGLDSLRMTNLRFQFEERLALSISIESMLSGKSLRELAEEAQDISSDRRFDVPERNELTLSSTGEYPLSMGQRAIWFLHLLTPESPAYNLFSASRSNRPFDIQVLRTAFQALVDRHPSLRSIVVNSKDGPVQQPVADYQVDFSLVDGTSWNDGMLNDYLSEAANQTFNPSEAPPFRVRVVCQRERGDVLLVVLHHLLADLASISILLEDLGAAYVTLLNGDALRLGEQPSYASFVAGQRHAFDTGRWDVQRDFWLEYLRGAQISLSSPFDQSSKSPSGTGGTLRFHIGEELASRVKRCASSSDVSLYTFLMAAFQALLLRLTAQDDLLVGSVVSGRTNPSWATAVGYCVNQIVLRARWNGASTFQEFLSVTQRDVSKALGYQDYPFSALTDDFHTLYGSRGEQLTKIMFSLQTTARDTDRDLSSFLMGHDGSTFQLGELELSPLEINNQGAQFDLSLVISEAASELFGIIQYRSDLIQREFVDRLAQQFQRVLDTVTADPLRQLQAIPLLSEAEHVQLLEEWNSTLHPYEKEITIDELFERQARVSPNAGAVRARDGGFTYKELSEYSDRLAKLLREREVSGETVVGLYCHRTRYLPVAMLAILKAGGAFLPLDPALPADRIAYMLEQTSAPIILTDEDGILGELSFKTPIEVIRVDVPSSWILRGQLRSEVGELSRRSSPEGLAYVIFTSGSTGRPKGVMVTHRNVINFFAGMDAQLECRQGDRFIATTSISFDISILELLWPLTHGAEMALIPERDRRGASLLSIGGRPSSRGPEFSLFYFADASEQRGPERYRLLLEGAKFADRNGFTAVWTPERHFHRFGGSYPNPSLTSAAIATVTERIAIRAGSVVLPLHDPIRVAEEWSTIDNLSGGRVGIAFASGWHVDDFVLAPDRYANRREVMLSGIDRLQQLWKGEPLEVVNGNGKSIQVQLYPRPVQRDLPIWITASGTPATFQLAGSLGANLLTHLLGQTLEEVASNIERYHDALRQNGFDPTTRSVTLMLHTYLGEDRDVVKNLVRVPFREYLRSSLGLVEKLISSLALPIDIKSLSPKDLEDLLDFAFNRYWETSGLLGTVDDCRSMVDRLAAIGVTEIACLIDFGVDSSLVLDSLPRLRDLMQASQVATSSVVEPPAQANRKPRTFLQCTPSMMKLLLTEGDDALLSTIDILMLGGEPLPGVLVDKIKERYDCRVFNMYGPTETTIWSTFEEMQSGDTPISVGRPIANTQCYIVDRRGLSVPPGVVGELLIGGEGVARGYWQRDDLTKEKFIKNRFRPQENSRLYRTGDLAKYLCDGRIEILGRTDHQVKIRGFRIELAEIELSLNTHDEVLDTVVLKHGAGDDVRLNAFYTSCGGNRIPSDDLKTFLRKILPEYMIPSEFVHLEKIPLMTNGKVDREQLARLQVQPHSMATKGDPPPSLPLGHLESLVLEIWKKVLDLDRVGLDDNFFDLGGHSLLMVQVHTALTERLGHPFPLLKLLENPTIQQLAASLSTHESSPTRHSDVDRASLQRTRLEEMRRNAVAMRSLAS